MKYIDEYQDKGILTGLVSRINRLDFPKKIRIMEVCGTHTRTVLENGINTLLPADIELISGPGCPICVTAGNYIDQAILLCQEEGVIIASFADLIRVPGSCGSLQQELARGKNIQLIYSPLEAVKLARDNPDQEVVLLAVGFETTIPTIALSIKQAKRQQLNNFSVLLALKVMPPVLRELLMFQEVLIDGFILPGHVAAITGSREFEFLATDFCLPGVITGFECADILMAVDYLARMILNKQIEVKNLYNRVVTEPGNQKARILINEIFEFTDADWRGIGRIKNSALRFKEKYYELSAEKRFALKARESSDEELCICGEILSGRQKPLDCKLFSRYCNPVTPRGACMVSREGACAVYYNYGRKEGLLSAKEE